MPERPPQLVLIACMQHRPCSSIRSLPWCCACRPPFSSCRTPQTKGELAGGRGYQSVAAGMVGAYPAAFAAAPGLAPPPLPASQAETAAQPACTGMGSLLLQQAEATTRLNHLVLNSHQSAVSEAAASHGATTDQGTDSCSLPGLHATAASRVDSCDSTALENPEAVRLMCSPAALQETQPDPSSSPAAVVPGDIPAAAAPFGHSSLAMLELEPVADGDWQV